MTLTEFYAARLDEDEAAAKAVTFRSRFAAEDFHVISPGGPGHPPMPVADVIDAETAAHIARHDPARVLREVEAKRKILAAYEPVARNDFRDSGEPEYAFGWAEGLGLAVRALAEAAAAHPDYDEAWRP